MKTRNLNMALLVTIIFNLLMTSSIVFGNTVWDITDDFSVDNGNPNGSWSYGWMDTDFTNFTLFESGNYTGGVPPESPIWYTESTSPKYGCVWKNTGPYTCGVDTGQLSMHPGVGGYYTGGPWPDGGIPAVSRWTAPEGISGLCTIEGQFLSGCYDNTIQVAVRINSTQVWYAVDSGAFNLSTTVAPGDTIDFVVYGGYNSGGNTPLDATITVVPEPATVAIDIKPGSYPNAVNLSSQGLTPVAILSEIGFDARTVNPATVSLSGALVAMRGKDKYMSHEEDVNKDGLVDLVVQVVTCDIDPGKLQQDGDVIYAVLTGSTVDGTAIEGEDEITIVPGEK